MIDYCRMMQVEARSKSFYNWFLWLELKVETVNTIYRRNENNLHPPAYVHCSPFILSLTSVAFLFQGCTF
jgi:hypothetical protein